MLSRINLPVHFNIRSFLIYFLYHSRSSHFVVTIISSFLNNFFILNPFKKGAFHKFKQLSVSTIEFIRLVSADRSLPILITYDFSISPHTYGDFLYVLFLARYFKLRNRHVYLYCPNPPSDEFISQFKSFSLSI